MTFNAKKKRFVYAYRFRRRIRHILKKCYQSSIKGQEARAAFILGSGRSGTDIVAHCLGKAWDSELINEDNPKSFVNWRLKALDTVSDSVSQSGAKVVLFKPIVETLRAQELLKHFPRSSVIFVTRDPYDAINSMVRFFGEGHIKAVKHWVATEFAQHQQAPDELKKFIRAQSQGDLSKEDASGLYWLLYNSAYHFLDLDSDERAMLVRYEDVVQEPDRTLKQVCAYLDLKWSSSLTDEIYSGSLRKNPKPDLSPEIDRACLAQWERLTGEKLSSSI